MTAPVVESWTGLRPGTSDGLPVIGNAGQPHCWLATGHFRNGILLAPATGLNRAPATRRLPTDSWAQRFRSRTLRGAVGSPLRASFRLSDKIQSAAL